VTQAAADAPDPAAPGAPAVAFETLALRTFVKLLRAAGAIEARLAPGIAAAGLTATQLGVLEALLHKGPLNQRALGRKLLSSPGNMTDVIDKLERRGLVLRTRKPGDRRAVRVELTAEGRDKIAALFPRHAASIAAAMAGLAPEELATLETLLRKLGRSAAGMADPTEAADSGVPDPLAEEYGLAHIRRNSFDIE
jgi:MarR family 2-MHQ and catechol resistance regulon transcriptional repressor